MNQLVVLKCPKFAWHKICFVFASAHDCELKTLGFHFLVTKASLTADALIQIFFLPGPDMITCFVDRYIDPEIIAINNIVI